MGDKKYCICCGEEVPYYIVERDQKREYACSYCGFTLDVLKLWEEMTDESRKETEEPGHGAIVETSEGIKEKIEQEEVKFEKKPEIEEKIDEKVKGPVKVEEEKHDSTVESDIKEEKAELKGITEDNRPATTSTIYSIIAEDSEFLRTLLKEVILRKSLSDHIIAVTNGLELVAEYTRLMNQGASVNFVIVDINMPEMDGLTAVKTIRTLEDKNSIERIPVVFFSAVKATEDLRKQMSILEPANYINKGVSTSPQALAERVEILLHFLTYRYARPGKFKATG